MKNPFFLGNSACFHTSDWYKSAEILYKQSIPFVTDTIDAEGLSCLVDNKQSIRRLIVIDRVLFSNPGWFGNKLRNVIKFALAPLQSVLVWRFIGRSKENITFAHCTYYAFIASLAGIQYVSTPQGSEILVRLDKSFLYRCFARLAHGNAVLVTVDSYAMQSKLKSSLGIDAVVIQNGVSVSEIMSQRLRAGDRFSRNKNELLSLRGVTDLYQIKEIFAARNTQASCWGLTVCCPFYDDEYLASVLDLLDVSKDTNLGRLSRTEFYQCLASSQVAISIPISDSSPRSVYEAIFFGCVVIVRYNPYVDALPQSMRDRLVITDCEGDWMTKSLDEAVQKAMQPYTPSDQDLNLFDQALSMNRLLEALQHQP